jgi:LmbE family N-acetylglucosaminyl deacetylase
MAKAQKTYDIMAVGAHPDDVEHCIGGSLIKWARAGKRIIIVHMSGGEKGTHGSKALRRKEATASAAALGCDVAFLDFPDTEIFFTPEARKKFIIELRRYQPKVVLAQYFDFPRFHPDHEQTGLIVRNSFRPARFKAISTPPFAPHWVKNVFYYLLPLSLKPTFVVDVSDVIEEWRAAAEEYKSQLHQIPGYYDRIMLLKTQAGFQIDAQYGEAFWSDAPINATCSLSKIRSAASRSAAAT